MSMCCISIVSMLEGFIIEVEFHVALVALFFGRLPLVAFVAQDLQIASLELLYVEPHAGIVSPFRVHVSDWFYAVEFEVFCVTALATETCTYVPKRGHNLSALTPTPFHLSCSHDIIIPLAISRYRPKER